MIIAGLPGAVPKWIHKRSVAVNNSSKGSAVSEHTAGTAMTQRAREYLQGLGTGDVVHNCGELLNSKLELVMVHTAIT